MDTLASLGSTGEAGQGQARPDLPVESVGQMLTETGGSSQAGLGGDR